MRCIMTRKYYTYVEEFKNCCVKQYFAVLKINAQNLNIIKIYSNHIEYFQATIVKLFLRDRVAILT